MTYADAVERGFGADGDYDQILKVYGQQDANEARRYSPAKLVAVNREAISGNPIEALISTSYVERQNLTMRMHMRRLTRLTNAFSKFQGPQYVTVKGIPPADSPLGAVRV